MAGTAEGYKKLKATMIANRFNGSEEAYLAWKRRSASKGGSAKTDKPKGFAAMTPEKRVEAGRKGGLVRGDLYKRNEVFQEYIPPVTHTPAEEPKPKRRFALWGR